MLMRKEISNLSSEEEIPKWILVLYSPPPPCEDKIKILVDVMVFPSPPCEDRIKTPFEDRNQLLKQNIYPRVWLLDPVELIIWFFRLFQRSWRLLESRPISWMQDKFDYVEPWSAEFATRTNINGSRVAVEWGIWHRYFKSLVYPCITPGKI